MEWVFLAASLVCFAGGVLSYLGGVQRNRLRQSLERHTVEIKRQNEMLARAERIVVTSVRGSESLTVGEITRGLKMTYSTAYGAVQKLIDLKLIVKSGDKLALV